MPLAHFQISVTGLGKWIRKTNIKASDVSRIAIKPAFRELSGYLMNTLNTLFTPQASASGAQYEHGYTGEYLRGIRSDVTEKELVIRDSGGRAQFLLTGTGPVRKTDQKGNQIIPYGVVEWAKTKLGLDEKEAWAVGRSVAAHGIGWPGGASPLPHEYPAGESRFAYPAWTIAQNAIHIENAAKRMGGLLVQYLDKA